MASAIDDLQSVRRMKDFHNGHHLAALVDLIFLPVFLYFIYYIGGPVVVIPMAVAERDGSAQLHINQDDQASSLLAMNENVRRSWTGGEALSVKTVVSVPTIRLDTFLNLAGIGQVDYLKIDTQGMDLGVLRSAGTRLRDILKITLVGNGFDRTHDRQSLLADVIVEPLAQFLFRTL